MRGGAARDAAPFASSRLALLPSGCLRIRVHAPPHTSSPPLHPPPPQATYYDDIPEETAEQAGAATGFVFLICLLANTMAMLLAWFFIFDTIQKEKDILEQVGGWVGGVAVSQRGSAAQRRAGQGRAAQGQRRLPLPSMWAFWSPHPPQPRPRPQGHPDVSALPQPGAPSLPASAPGGREDPGVGHPLGGGNAVLLDDAGGNASHLYVDVVGGWRRRCGAVRGRATGLGTADQPTIARSGARLAPHPCFPISPPPMSHM